MKTNEKKEILTDIFSSTDKMNSDEKNYLLGYIRGFNDKKSINKDKQKKEENQV